ncbi:hypothetical protein SUDANB171_02779 [Streptomyces sp. enrichment culture]|uniref:DUF6177 family protein n=1 Tax=Streptomyces sp. enrichment culture TaxID=1795815 RepID=UPI003F55DEE2
MTTDVIALTERMPDPWSVVAGLMAGGPGTLLSAERAEGALLQLCDERGRPLVSVEAPMLVRLPGEVARLLGPEAVVSGPVWWTEVRAATGARRAPQLAGVIAARLVRRLGGTVWPPGAVPPDGGEAPVTGVVGAAAPAAAQPAVDVLTDSAAVVIQERPLVAATAWLGDALRAAQAAGRALQIVTPRGARLSLPTRSLLGGLPNRWVVQDGAGGTSRAEPGGGYYDGLSGSVLRWQDGAFAATGTPAPQFLDGVPRAAVSEEGQLLLTFTTRRPAERDLLLGGPLETVWRVLTGGPPAGWGTCEPAALPWSREELTDLVRARAPEPTWLVVVGHPEGAAAIATLRVRITTGGVEEEVTFALGRAGGTPAEVPGLPELAGTLSARYGLVSLLAQHRRARADLEVPAQLEAGPAPLAFALGADDVHRIGLPHALRPPVSTTPVRLDPAERPGLYYPVPDGDWQAFQHLMAHLHSADPARGRAAAGG